MWAGKTTTTRSSQGANGGDTTTISEPLADALKFIFSWVVLMPIAVIITGKLLAQTLKLPVRSKQFFRIHVPLVFTLQADNDEVVLGFVGFIFNLLVIGVLFGESAWFNHRRLLEPVGLILPAELEAAYHPRTEESTMSAPRWHWSR